ncbi:GNAT family N-acetyltransferase [Formosa sp. A9]|uniref:GNAT family N-acetyltransferase n=1 Tax=Formosa sp. A9 TaxID=3442641 RepID=UPI003EB79AAD
MNISIRQATANDIPEITALFKDTITKTCAKDYNDKQLQVWSSGAFETDKWLERINDYYFIVAETSNTIVGFAYLKKGYYLDGLFVHPNYLRQGIASSLLRTIESRVMIEDYPEIRSDVSKTALPFFEAMDFVVIKKQNKSHKGLNFLNYIVAKAL